MATRLEALARAVDAQLQGDPGCLIDRVDTIQDADGEGAICFLANNKYRKYLSTTRASAVILGAEFAEGCPVNALVCDNPYLAYARVSALLNPRPPVAGGIHPSAFVDEGVHVDSLAYIGPCAVVSAGAHVGPGAYIGPGSVLECDTSVGEESRLVANVTVCKGSRIGKRAIIHPGVVIGSDGFGFANDNGVWEKVPQLGNVVVGDDVEIGANTTVDRGALRDTVIEQGVKLDNQIQIAHNVHVGAHSAMAGCTGVAGSTTIGAHCTFGGGVVVVGHLELGDNTHFSAMSLVSRSVKEPGLYSGNLPATPNSEWRKTIARTRQLDDMARRLKQLEKQVAQQAEKEATDD
ncbi:UDP-3-O-(3-hydroxymyristoyl)glucosamine N-acyltransferase [Solemya velesiana gill symbiont]|uniref:UDP-3-O-acylglucosamine N-acyltransferase n=1 Tax=Solemya velesiana gill symbiont TaxID=1918948 RepID=A0A1T2KW89_9GAMM|nr:UDP-3-O-(3-hydroxymyristoyl)glucosamine N-acyltransferase [Solemya velesiana gill symbiont]OOZ37113.1 UDP-3-O-(3-hydroxymyristoyl)glucosamine N-acyltransferase [Solemya velesiana gill symbiont]